MVRRKSAGMQIRHVRCSAAARLMCARHYHFTASISTTIAARPPQDPQRQRRDDPGPECLLSA